VTARKLDESASLWRPTRWKEQEKSFGGRVVSNSESAAGHWHTRKMASSVTWVLGLEAWVVVVVVVWRRWRGRTWDSSPSLALLM